MVPEGSLPCSQEPVVLLHQTLLERHVLMRFHSATERPVEADYFRQS
jgi:hypothetical protein